MSQHNSTAHWLHIYCHRKIQPHIGRIYIVTAQLNLAHVESLNIYRLSTTRHVAYLYGHSTHQPHTDWVDIVKAQRNLAGLYTFSQHNATQTHTRWMYIVIDQLNPTTIRSGQQMGPNTAPKSTQTQTGQPRLLKKFKYGSLSYP